MALMSAEKNGGLFYPTTHGKPLKMVETVKLFGPWLALHKIPKAVLPVTSVLQPLVVSIEVEQPAQMKYMQETKICRYRIPSFDQRAESLRGTFLLLVTIWAQEPGQILPSTLLPTANVCFSSKRDTKQKAEDFSSAFFVR